MTVCFLLKEICCAKGSSSDGIDACISPLQRGLSVSSAVDYLSVVDYLVVYLVLVFMAGRDWRKQAMLFLNTSHSLAIKPAF